MQEQVGCSVQQRTSLLASHLQGWRSPASPCSPPSGPHLVPAADHKRKALLPVGLAGRGLHRGQPLLQHRPRRGGPADGVRALLRRHRRRRGEQQRQPAADGLEATQEGAAPAAWWSSKREQAVGHGSSATGKPPAGRQPPHFQASPPSPTQPSKVASITHLGSSSAPTTSTSSTPSGGGSCRRRCCSGASSARPPPAAACASACCRSHEGPHLHPRFSGHTRLQGRRGREGNCRACWGDTTTGRECGDGCRRGGATLCSAAHGRVGGNHSTAQQQQHQHAPLLDDACHRGAQPAAQGGQGHHVAAKHPAGRGKGGSRRIWEAATPRLCCACGGCCAALHARPSHLMSKSR